MDDNGLVWPNGGEIRRQRGAWTLEQLAEETMQIDPDAGGVHVRTIQRVEKGTRVKFKTILLLAQALDVSPKSLVIADKLHHGVESSLRRPTNAPPDPDLDLFVGREKDLQELKQRLGIASQQNRTQVISAIRGWPGVGKTTMAAALAHDADIATAFPDGVLWVSLGQQPDLLSKLAVLGRVLEATRLLSAATLEEAQEHLTALLHNKRVLLIVDDVWEPEHANPFRWACRGECALLLTTREPGVANHLVSTPDAIYNLPVLTKEKALELLEALAPKVVPQHQEACLKLVQALECLPLALHVAGRLLQVEAGMGWGVDDLLAALQEGGGLLHAPPPSDLVQPGQETPPTVDTLLRKSTDRLDEHTRECFASLGSFEAKPATFDLQAMEACWQVPDPKPIVRVLVARGLLERLETGRFWMHALLHQHARFLLTL